MFPPPLPWKQIATVDPDRELTSRFFLKSLLHLPSFLAQTQKIVKQVGVAPGSVGWSLGANLPTLESTRSPAGRTQRASARSPRPPRTGRP